MKDNRSTGIVIGIFTVVVLLVLFAALALNGYIPGFGPKTVSVAGVTTTADPCSQASLQVAVPQVDELTRQYDDTVTIAETLPGDQLVPIVTQLQTVRRNAEDLNVPSCMQNLKQLQLSYMNTYIQAMLFFGQNYSGIATASALNNYAQAVSGTQTPSPIILAYISQGNQLSSALNQGIAQAKAYRGLYEAERARLLGVTLTPTLIQPPPPAANTPAVGATPAPTKKP
jgi:hypothetical protein